jgi:hypothetical protein
MAPPLGKLASLNKGCLFLEAARYWIRVRWRLCRSMLHTSFMTDAIEGRVEAREIIDLVWLHKSSGAGARLNVLCASGLFALVVDLAFFRRALWLALPISLIPVVFFVLKVDIIRLQWLASEILGLPKFSYDVSLHPDDSPDGERALSAGKICPRELICTPQEHAKLLNPPQQLPPLTSAHQDLLRSYKLVLISASESGRVVLGVLGEARPRYEWQDEKYFLRKHPLDSSVNLRRNSRKEAIEVGDAMTDLMVLLPSADESVPEDIIVERLVLECGNSDWSARNAIRIAEAAKLVLRVRVQPKFAMEAFKIFGSHAEFGGHAGCRLQLTQQGHLWKKAKPLPRSEGAITDPKTTGDNNVTHIYYGDAYVNNGQATSVGRKNSFRGSAINQQWRQDTGIDPEHLAQDLARLVAALQAQATTTEQFKALSVVESARKAAEMGDRETTLSNLAKLDSLTKWVMTTATGIGVGVAIQAIEMALGMLK